MKLLDTLIPADWPAPKHVRAYTSTRIGGASQAPYDSLNLGGHVKDDPAHVNQNRQQLAAALDLSEQNFQWLEQVHGTCLVEALDKRSVPQADGVYTSEQNHVCVVMTADCLPVLMCDAQGTRVAAVHAGWRGLAAGILELAVEQFPNPEEVLTWFGPAIGPSHFEVGQDVYDAYVEHNRHAQSAFIPKPLMEQGVSKRKYAEKKYLADIYQLAKQRLHSVGVDQVYGGQHCTVSEPELFYSYRRDGAHTGRMASLVYLSS